MLYGSDDANNKLLELLFCNHLKLDDLDLINYFNMSNYEIGNCLAELVHKKSVSDIMRIIKMSEYERVITTNNIPQFSDYDVIDNVIAIILDSGIIGIKYKRLGYYLAGKNKSEAAQAKYGENHYKLVMQLGFATEDERHSINSFGIAYNNVVLKSEKAEISAKMALKIPIIQELLIQTDNGIINASKILRHYLSESTMIRRRSNIKKLLGNLAEFSDPDFIVRINSIIWE